MEDMQCNPALPQPAPKERRNSPKLNKATVREFLEGGCCSVCQYICCLLYMTVINQFKDDLA